MPGANRTPRPGLWEKVRGPLRRLRSDYRQFTGPLRGLPSALIIGAQKGGTTSLFNYLVEHPDVLPPLTKEVHFFDLHYARGVTWYRGRFPYTHLLRNGSLTVDASPYYLVHPQAPERAARLLPQARLIAVLRNPVDRALSHYQHEVRSGREQLSFEEAIEREPERLAGEEDRMRADPSYYSYAHHRYSYLRRGLYLEQLRQWVEKFPRNQLLVLQSESLFQDPAAAMAVVHRFLGLRPHRLEDYKPFYPGNYDPGLAAALRARLADYFAPHNQKLYEWLGEDFGWQ